MFGKRRSSRTRKKPATPVDADRPALIKSPSVETFKRPAVAKPAAGFIAPRAKGARPPAPRHVPGRTLVVGRDICLMGEIASCEKLIVDGRVEGEVTDTQRLEINESGRFKGSAVVADCVVAGSFEGDLRVQGVLSLRPGAQVSGTVRYAEIEITRGGRLAGDIEALPAAEAAPPPRPAPEPAPETVDRSEAGRAEAAPEPPPESGSRPG